MSAECRGTMDILEIMEYLPHRYPFLMLDRVTECVSGKWIRGIKNVTMNEPFFQGHFPGYPVMPGVLVIEALAQIASILAWQALDKKPGDGTMIFFAGIDNARFRRQVFPGDQLILEAEVQRLVRGVGKYKVRALVGGDPVAEADLLAAMRNPIASAQDS
jgi:3-hydroxyacyl-[acyl-carrier-protein] dehydratase